jgi:RimJ/RimL family protein N-acetyltransferase
MTFRGECLDDAETVTLLDGAEVFVRRLNGRDVDAVIQLHQRLTDHEQYLRFFVTHPAYLETFASKVVQCNDKQCALGAFDSDGLIGVANYVLSGEPGVAEVAVAVAHEDHLRGVATTLLRRLGKIALSNGIHFFVADVLAENVSMLKVLSDAGWRHTTDFDGQVMSILIDLADVTDPYARGAINADCAD